MRSFMKDALRREPPRFDVLLTIKTDFGHNGIRCCGIIFVASLLFFSYAMFTIERYQESMICNSLVDEECFNDFWLGERAGGAKRRLLISNLT